MKRLLFLGFALVSCAHLRLGDPCAPQAATCADKASALVCKDGVFSSLPCRGPKGCSVTSSLDVMCDQTTGAHPGDACAEGYAGQAQCTTDALGYMVCASGAWVQVACPAGQRCQAEGGIACK